LTVIDYYFRLQTGSLSWNHYLGMAGWFNAMNAGMCQSL